MASFQRDGIHRMDVNKGQVSYEPNSLAPDGPRKDPHRGFASVTALDAGDKVRQRSEAFADHYSQPRLFWRSMSEPEQRHIVNAFTFELSKVSRPNIRKRMLGTWRTSMRRSRRGSRRGSAWRDRRRRSRRRVRRST